MSKSSQRWLEEHFSDPYVKQAQQNAYRSRAVFKLKQIQEKDRLIKPGMRIVDLGAAPGGWSQYASQQLRGKGQVIALDRLPMDPLPGVSFIEGDFHDEAVYDALLALLDGEPVDLVLSDMAPNLSGLSTVDQPQAMALAELALDFCDHVLRPGGTFLVKVFQGAGFDPYLQALRERFDKVITRKPEASRARSKELYLLAKSRISQKRKFR